MLSRRSCLGRGSGVVDASASLGGKASVYRVINAHSCYRVRLHGFTGFVLFAITETVQYALLKYLFDATFVDLVNSEI